MHTILESDAKHILDLLFGDGGRFFSMDHLVELVRNQWRILERCHGLFFLGGSSGYNNVSSRGSKQSKKESSSSRKRSSYHEAHPVGTIHEHIVVPARFPENYHVWAIHGTLDG